MSGRVIQMRVGGAEEINQEHRLARSKAESAVQHAIRCGELLMRQKAELKHGEFKPWIETNCEFSYQSARVYMNATRQKDRGLSFSSLAQALGYGEETPPPAQQTTLPIDPPPATSTPPPDFSTLDLSDESDGATVGDVASAPTSLLASALRETRELEEMLRVAAANRGPVSVATEAWQDHAIRLQLMHKQINQRPFPPDCPTYMLAEIRLHWATVRQFFSTHLEQ